MRCRDVPSDLADVDVVLRAADFDALATPVDAVAVMFVNLHMGSFTNMTTRHPRNPDTYHSHGDGNASENRLDCAWRRMLSCCLLQQNELKWSVRDVQIVQIGVCVAGTYLPTLRM